MGYKLPDISGSIYRFLEAWNIVRMCPEKMTAPKEIFAFNYFALAITIVVFALARGTVAGSDQTFVSTVAATIISSFVLFITGSVSLIFNPGENWRDRVRRWGLFFVMLWIASLAVVICIDGVFIWNDFAPVTSDIIYVFSDPGSLSPFIIDIIRALIVSAIALAVVLFKTKRMDPSQMLFDKCIVTTIACGAFMNSALLVMFLYGNIL